MSGFLFNPAGAALRILLVEADAAVASDIQALLPGVSGLACEWARASGMEEAAAMLDVQPIDVVMLDLDMPGHSGIESLLSLRSMAPEMPVVVVTREDDEDLGVQSVRAGAQEYLVKGEMESRMVARIVRYAIERQQVESRLRASLQEKETLLREVHHRVKNNLQVILSLLRLGAEHLPEGEARRIFQDSHNRIRSMAMIHETLYQSQNISKVPFHDYVKELMRELFAAHNAWSREIEMDLQVSPVELGIDTAIPCGLILHELVTNSLEHAFPEGRGIGYVAGGAAPLDRKWVQVVFRRIEPERLHLQVSDNGIGLPPEGELRAKQSVGLKLVAALAGQLGGSIQTCCGPPAVYGIVFSEKRRGPKPKKA